MASAVFKKMRALAARKNLPKSRVLRISLGLLLVCGGLAGFLPILGFWMIPMGLAVLAADVPIAKTWLKKVEAFFDRVSKKFKSRRAAKKR